MWEALQELNKSTKTPVRERAAGEPPDDGGQIEAPQQDREGLVGVQSVSGLGMEGFDCWKAYVSPDGKPECDWDPFSVPESVVYERTQTFFLKRCEDGHLSNVGVPEKNYAAARDFIEHLWHENRKKFREMEAAFVLGGDEGLAKVIKLCRAGDLERYCVKKGDVVLAKEWWNAVNREHADLFQTLREKNNAIRPKPANEPSGNAGGH